jgi:hypothetical protein
MRTFITTAAVLAVLSVPAFAEGDDSSTKAGEAKGNVKATTEQKQEPLGSNASGGAVAIPRATTGASSRSDEMKNKEETSSPANPGRKTGVTGGGDDSGGSNSGAGGGSSGSGGTSR